MILDLDFGNSRIKWRMLGADGDVHRGVCTSVESLVDAVGPQINNVERVRVSCVGQSRQLAEFSAWLDSTAGLQCEQARVTAEAGGVLNCYQIPEQLGVDRWLVVCAARSLGLGPHVVIDAGSALTIDFLDGHGCYQGGYIVPGTALMAQALQQSTERVLFNPTAISGQLLSELLRPGLTTQQAVTRGLVMMQVAFIEHAAESFIAQLGQSASLWLTGGDAEALSPYLSLPHRVELDMVFTGIEILLP